MRVDYLAPISKEEFGNVRRKNGKILDMIRKVSCLFLLLRSIRNKL